MGVFRLSFSRHFRVVVGLLSERLSNLFIEKSKTIVDQHLCFCHPISRLSSVVYVKRKKLHLRKRMICLGLPIPYHSLASVY